MAPSANEDLPTRMALLEQSDRRDAKDFEEYKVQNAKEHEDLKVLVEDGFAATTKAMESFGSKVEKRLDKQDDRIEGHGERLDTVEKKTAKLSWKTGLMWGGIGVAATALLGTIIKWGWPLLFA